VAVLGTRIATLCGVVAALASPRALPQTVPAPSDTALSKNV
jgi:hypothetical protein